MIRTDYRPSGFFVMRRPLLPFDDFRDWGAAGRLPRGSGEISAVDWRRTCDALRRALQETLERPEVREALFLGSRSLLERYPVWVEDPESEKSSSIEAALVKYFARMTGRSTPFGLFAGCSVGVVGARSSLRPKRWEGPVRRTQIGFGCLSALLAPTVDTGRRAALTVVPNDSRYRVGDCLRYFETTTEDRESCVLAEVAADPPVVDTLEYARGGRTCGELVRRLVQSGYSEEDASAFIDELMDAQLLVPETVVPVTGDVNLVVSQLLAERGAPQEGRLLRRVLSALEEIDLQGLGQDPDRYMRLESAIGRVASGTNGPETFQVDMVRSDEDLVLGQNEIEQIANGVQALYDLFGERSDRDLDEFRGAFERRFGDQEVPILEAIDDDVGVGFAGGQWNAPRASDARLLEGLHFPTPRTNAKPARERFTQFLQNAVFRAVEREEEELVLAPDDLAPFIAGDRRPLADAFHAIVTLVPGTLDGDRPGVILKSVAGPSGMQALGRFCKSDRALDEYVKAHLRDEEALAPEEVFCDIVHLPENRLGHLVTRPVLRRFELPILGRSGVSRDRRLELSDLLVSIRDGRIVLRSQRLGKRVRPRLTNAHNATARGVPVYRFLVTLQREGVVASLRWNWGVLGSLPRLPRVRIGRVIVCRQRWNLSAEEIARLFGGRWGREAFARIREWRTERRLPQFVAIVSGDNTLTLDLENPLSARMFVREVRRRHRCVLEEVFAGHNGLAAKGDGGGFQHELVVPFVRREREERQRHQRVEAPVPIQGAEPASRFDPGTEWLFTKLYTGTATADRVLLDVVRSTVSEARGNGWIDKWFFIRYRDPDRHLRVRWHGEPDVLMGKLLPTLRARIAALPDHRVVWKTQLDSYRRELRRYGGRHGIDICESVFHADSEAVLGIIDATHTAPEVDGDVRWKAALIGIECLMEDGGLEIGHRHAVVAKLADMLQVEYGVRGGAKRHVLDKFRRERPKIRALLEDRKDVPAVGTWAGSLVSRSALLRPLLGRLRELDRQGNLTLPFHDIVGSLIHMHANRVLRCSARQQELLIYRFLERTYDSRLARTRPRSTRTPRAE